MPRSEDELATIMLMNGIGTILSYVGELFMIYSYFAHPYNRRYSMKLVISLIFSDVGYTFANTLSYFNRNHHICFIEGFLRCFFVISSLVWVMIMLHISYKQIVNPSPRIEEGYPKLLALNIGLSMVPVIVVAFSHLTSQEAYYGHFLGFCGVVPEFWEMVLIEVPMWFLIISTGFYIYWIVRAMRTLHPNKTNVEYRSIIIYPIILTVLWLPNTIDRIIYFFTDDTIYEIALLHIIATRLEGFANAVIYGKRHLKILKAAKKRSLTSFLKSGAFAQELQISEADL